MAKRKRSVEICVLGYYFRNNLGDDSFINAFECLFRKALPDCTYKLLFCNTDDIEKLPDGTDVVICGGGDIVNTYFIHKIKAILESSGFKGPVYAIGIGITGQSLVECG